jgi:hypothetical protein
MPFCYNCGQKIDANAKFCSGCGAKIAVQTSNNTANNTTSNTRERRTVYEWEIRKCPNCGGNIDTFIARCPACGFQLNNKKVSAVLQNFINQINECERNIENSSTAGKNGWQSWGKGERFWWIVLNILMVCIPLAIYLAIPLLMVKSTPKLSREEKRLASLVENFPFPNDRESILSVLVFVKDKIDYISKETINRKNAYWMRLWCTQAEHLKQKADMLFPNDPIVRDSYNEILADECRVNKILKIKSIVGLVLLVGAIIFFFVRNGTFEHIKKVNTVVEIPETELSVLMPQIEGGKGEVVTNNSEYFSVTYFGISESEFERYKNECKENGFTIDCESSGSLFDAYNEEGYNIEITYYSSEMHITVTDDLEMRTIVWPDSEVADMLPVPDSDYGYISSSSDSCLTIYVGNVTIDDYADYVNECIKKGFDQDMSQTDDYYYADNKDGYHVQVEYSGFNTVFIRIDD